MALRFLLDTNICIYITREKPAAVRARFQRLGPGEAAISAITYGELCFGAMKSARRDLALRNLQDLTGTLSLLPVSEEAARSYGAIRADLEGRGQPIGSNDLWIAAQAHADALVLVTNNEREFRRIDGLKVQNWAART